MQPESPPIPAAPAPGGSARKVELDWLRLGIILAVFLFHTTRFFDPEDWHVKNAVAHPWLLVPDAIFTTWAMPLLFVISGAGVSFSLRSRGVARYLRERVLRLLVPLAVGAFTHVAWQVYLERLSHGQFRGSFLEFLPRYLDGLYGYGGNFAYQGLHLWYLELLFVFSVVFLPLFLWCRTSSGRRALERLAALLCGPGRSLLLAIPVALAVALPDPGGFWGGRWWGGWNVLGHACFFVAGFLLASSEALYRSLRRQVLPALVVVVAVGTPLSVLFIGVPPPAHGTLRAWAFLGGYALVAWASILAILGGAVDAARVRPPLLLARATELVLPFYVLHQTVILTVGYPVVRWAMPDLAKWATIAVCSLVGTVGLCMLVRRSAVLRVLFGMKPVLR
jgi:glucan biosynthesis protein C